MNDLIDRQAAITAICEDGTWLERQGCTEITMCERKQRDADILSELPTIDAVPVIRCKDCVHYKGHWYCETWNNSPGFPAVKEDGFCNMAERRTDAN